LDVLGNALAAHALVCAPAGGRADDYLADIRNSGWNIHYRI